MDISYQTLFLNKKNENDFCIYVNDRENIRLCLNKDKFNDKLRFLDKMLNFFIDREEYEKCIKLEKIKSKNKKNILD